MCVELADGKASKKLTGAQTQKPRIAVAGLGVVGEGVALRLMEEAQDFTLCAALVRDVRKRRAAELSSTSLVDDVAALLSERPDIIIDATPGGDAGRALIATALQAGVSVISANKQAVAGSLVKFHELAKQSGAKFSYSASVGGGAPMVETVRHARSAGAVRSITAILNGTVNFILGEAAAGVSFDDAVKKAQAAGFAEPDPTADLSGDDARAKISILCFEAFGEEIPLDDIAVEALDAARAGEFARDGRPWKQLARIEQGPDGHIIAQVKYECVADDHFLRDVEGEENALRLVTAPGGEFTCKGKGAGRAPTVASIFADLG